MWEEKRKKAASDLHYGGRRRAWEPYSACRRESPREKRGGDAQCRAGHVTMLQIIPTIQEQALWPGQQHLEFASKAISWHCHLESLQLQQWNKEHGRIWLNSCSSNKTFVLSIEMRRSCVKRASQILKLKWRTSPHTDGLLVERLPHTHRR